jgi:hypothetical protein
MFRMLGIFQRNHGHCLVPKNARLGSLGQWVARQQLAFRNGSLRRERIRRLEHLGFVFEAAAQKRSQQEENEARWEKNFQELLEFKRVHGHFYVPRRGGEHRSLGIWVQNLRDQHRRGRLRKDRGRRLEKVQFTWNYASPNWEKKFEQLLTYKKRFGHCDVPARWPENRPLAHWVDNQRCFRRRGQLREDRIRRLDQVGLSWSTRFHPGIPREQLRHHVRTLEDYWDEMFAKLVRFKQKHGHCSVPKNDGVGSHLNMWVRRRRAEWRQGLLRKDRQRRLEQLGFDLKHRKFSWEKKFERLLAYKKRFGHCDVPARWPKDRPLAHWVDSQRGFRRRGMLSQERIQQLDEIGFTWSTRFERNSPPASYQAHRKVLDQLWDLRFNELARFKKQHGHCNVPANDSSYRTLRRWVESQREHWRSGALREDRKARLERVGFQWKVKNPSWDRRFEELLTYKQQYGHCDVPVRGPRNRLLGHWASNQRCFRCKGMLSQERIDRLDHIGFPWTSPRSSGGGPKRGEIPCYAAKQWDRMLAKLKQFKQRHGHLKVPSRNKTKPSLWQWLSLQRSQWRHGRLSEERRKRLQELGVEVVSPRR